MLVKKIAAPLIWEFPVASIRQQTEKGPLIVLI